MKNRKSHSDLQMPSLAFLGLSVLFLFLVTACDLKSQVEFAEIRKDITDKAPMNPHAPIGNDQGAVVSGETVSGYKVKASLGAQINSVEGKTASGYDVRLNFVGKVSQ